DLLVCLLTQTAVTEFYTLSLHDALPILVGAGWVATHAVRVADGESRVEVHPWVESIGLELAFSMGALQWVMALVVLVGGGLVLRSEEHTSELQSRENLVCRLLLEKKNKK